MLKELKGLAVYVSHDVVDTLVDIQGYALQEVSELFGRVDQQITLAIFRGLFKLDVLEDLS